MGEVHLRGWLKNINKGVKEGRTSHTHTTPTPHTSQAKQIDTKREEKGRDASLKSHFDQFNF